MNQKRSPITSHVLDTSSGYPAAQIKILLEIENGGAWTELSRATTNRDGRVEDLLPPEHSLKVGQYRLTFFTGEYYGAKKIEGFYPSASICFKVNNSAEHYHIPLLLSPFGYSTYRGS